MKSVTHIGNQPIITLSRGEKIRIAIIFSIFFSTTAIGYSAALVVGNIAMILGGLGIVACVLGLCHGFDANHITTI